MNKLLIISGPTATGKTSLAFQLAQKFNGELISADSRQVYRGMDIVTGKEIDKNINTWILDVANPDENFSVSEYYKLAWEAIGDIWREGKLPIVVGGTGFYIKALLDGIGTMGIEPDWEFRNQLESLSVEELGKKLREVDLKRWERMNDSDRKNPRRLIRAIEIAGKLEVSRQWRASPKAGSEKLEVEMDLLWIGLTTSFLVLYKRIDERVDERLKLGAVEETKQLAKRFGWDIPSMTGQGYRQLRGFIGGMISLEDAIKRWKFAEHEYARKQTTWFKKEKRIAWFELTDADFTNKIEKKVKAWYTT